MDFESVFSDITSIVRLVVQSNQCFVKALILPYRGVQSTIKVMTDEMYDDYAIERACQQAFDVKLDISEVVARQIPTGFISAATLFKTSPNMLYVFIRSQSNQLLADVQKMLRQMNVEADTFLPPYGEKDYFKRIGEEKFKTMYPGKHIMTDEDTRYQRTLAPY